MRPILVAPGGPQRRIDRDELLAEVISDPRIASTLRVDAIA